MRSIVTLILYCTLIAAGPAEAWNQDLQCGFTVLFDRSQQKHPKTAVLAIPITGEVTGANTGSLSFEAAYWTYFWATDDPRNGKGKVKLKIEVLRDDQVMWKKERRARVKEEQYPGGNFNSADFSVCNKFTESLQPGDLVLFHFTFRRLPLFDAREAAVVQINITDTTDCG